MHLQLHKDLAGILPTTQEHFDWAGGGYKYFRRKFLWSLKYNYFTFGMLELLTYLIVCVVV